MHFVPQNLQKCLTTLGVLAKPTTVPQNLQNQASARIGFGTFKEYKSYSVHPANYLVGYLLNNSSFLLFIR